MNKARETSFNKVRGIEDEFLSRMEKVFIEVEKKLAMLMGSGDFIKTADMAISRQNILKILEESGYYTVARDMMTAGYQNILEESFNLYRETLDKSLQFSELSLKQIEALRQLDLSQFTAIPETKVNDIAGVFTQVQFGAISKNEAVNQVTKNLDILKSQAKTLVTTGTSSIYRTGNYLLAKDAGLTKYEYMGPLDKITRPFCKEHLGQVHTANEWNRIGYEQGVPLQPVMVYGGGWQCRHSLIAVG